MKILVANVGSTSFKFKLFDMDLEEIRHKKLEMIKKFEEGISLYHLQKYQKAYQLFQECLKNQSRLPKRIAGT